MKVEKIASFEEGNEQAIKRVHEINAIARHLEIIPSEMPKSIKIKPQFLQHLCFQWYSDKIFKAINCT